MICALMHSGEICHLSKVGVTGCVLLFMSMVSYSTGAEKLVQSAECRQCHVRAIVLLRTNPYYRKREKKNLQDSCAFWLWTVDKG